MAKFIDRDWASKDDPMFLEGLKLNLVRVSKGSTKSAPKGRASNPKLEKIKGKLL
jgi:hypothetical protein